MPIRLNKLLKKSKWLLNKILSVAIMVTFYIIYIQLLSNHHFVVFS